MENLKYISAQHRIELVHAYAHKEGITSKGDLMSQEEFNELESYLFEDPINRRFIDKGIEKANEEVDLERYQQYSPEWYIDVVKFVPAFKHAKVVDTAAATQLEVVNRLDKNQMIFLATIIFLAVRGEEIKESDISRAYLVATNLYHRLVDSIKETIFKC